MKRWIVFALIMALTACQQKPKITGRWKLISVDYSPYAEQIDPNLVEAFLAEMDKQSEKIVHKTYFTFGETLLIESPSFGGQDLASEKGTWEIIDGKDSLKMTTQYTERFKVSWKSFDTLVLSTLSLIHI